MAVVEVEPPFAGRRVGTADILVRQMRHSALEMDRIADTPDLVQLPQSLVYI
jgi:hypothetical protein